MAEVTAEQIEEFKRRKAAGPKYQDEQLERKEFTKKQYLAFLKATDSKCNGDS